MNTDTPVKSPVRGNSHAGFGGRPAETERPKGRHRAAGRPYAATDALDTIRREVWNEARRQPQHQLAKELKGARFALWKNPGNLTERQQLKLARLQKLNQRLYRAYLLAQQLRHIYRLDAERALALLEAWLTWARRCRLEPFVKLARRITEQRHRVEAAITNKLSNAAVEQINTQIRLITEDVRIVVELWWRSPQIASYTVAATRVSV